MPTYKKHFRRKIKTVKKRQKKKDRHMKVLVCYKININNSKFGGAPEKDHYDRLNAMLIELKTSPIDEKFINVKKLIDEIVKEDGTINDNAKRKKIFKQIFKETVLPPSRSLDETKEQKQKKDEITQERQNIKHLLDHLTSDKSKYTEEDKSTLLNLLKKKVIAEEILKEITQKIDTPEFKQLFTAAKLKSIKKDLTNGNGNGIASSLTSIKSSILDGAVSLGQWFSPQIDSSSDIDEKKKGELENKQIVRFLWYPRKHTVYKKGNSTPNKNLEDAHEYGDFMIVVEPEKYASTGEFFKQTYHSVEDLLATLLLGCNDMFCTKSGVNPGQTNDWSESVKRRPYNWRKFDIVNTQPQKDLDAQNNADIKVRSDVSS